MRGQQVPVSRPRVGVHEEARQRRRENRAPGWPGGWGCSCTGEPSWFWGLAAPLGGAPGEPQEPRGRGLRSWVKQEPVRVRGSRKGNLGERVKQAARGRPPLPDGTEAGSVPAASLRACPAWTLSPAAQTLNGHEQVGG